MSKDNKMSVTEAGEWFRTEELYGALPLVQNEKKIAVAYVWQNKMNEYQYYYACSLVPVGVGPVRGWVRYIPAGPKCLPDRNTECNFVISPSTSAVSTVESRSSGTL